jgi:hypothetical protein
MHVRPIVTTVNVMFSISRPPACFRPYKLMRHNLFYLDANNYISSCLTVWLTCEKCRRVKNSKHSHLEHKSLYDLFGV